MKRILGIVGVVLLGLIAVLVVRTLRFTSKQIAISPIAAIAIDESAVATRLSQAVRFQTVSHQDAARIDGNEFLGLHRYLATQFPLVHAQLTREVISQYALLYTWRGSDAHRKPVVLLSHLDVVPIEPGTEGQWTQPPFDGRIADGFIWGRGTMDDKFGVLAILEAVEMLLHDGVQPQATVYLAFGHDEEVGGDTGAQQIAKLLRTRNVEAEYVLDEGGALTRGLLPGISAPIALIGIAEKGSVSLDLRVHAIGGHSSAPPSHTAVGVVSAAVHHLETEQMPVRFGAVQRFLDFVGPELPFTYRLVFANLWLFGGLVEHRFTAAPATNATVRTTTAATMIDGGVKENVLPTSARAVVNFRILPGDSAQEVIDHTRRAVNDPQVEIQPLRGVREPTTESPIDVAAFTQLARTIREVYPGAIVTPYLTIGGTDARHYAELTKNIYRFTPIVGDPSDLARMHGINERMSVQNYAQAVRFFVQLIKNSA